jgi:hypothetical protein
MEIAQFDKQNGFRPTLIILNATQRALSVRQRGRRHDHRWNLDRDQSDGFASGVGGRGECRIERRQQPSLALIRCKVAVAVLMSMLATSVIGIERREVVLLNGN